MIDELIERVERGTGADRELDGKIARALSGSKDHWFPFAGGFTTEQTAPPLSGSLDAVLALIEEKLPGAFGDVDLGALPVDQPLYGARLFSADWDPWKNAAAEAASPARALLAAFLKAHKEQHDGR